MEQLSDEEIDHGAEEDSDKEDQDLDKMFGAWLGELDKLTQSLDSDKPVEPVKRSPLHQETNMANFSYRFSIYNLNEALNQGETVDLDALMADLCSIEQELSSIGSGSSKRQITETKATQKLPASRHPSKHGTLKGLSSSSNRIAKPSHANYSLDDITAQLEQASLSMDEAAQQSVLEDTKPIVTNQHRRTASAGTVSDAEVHSISNSSRSSITSAASSMDSLDIDKVTRPQELDLTHQAQSITEHAISLRCPSKQAHRHTDFTEEQAELTPHSYLDRETSLLLRNIAGKPSHLLTKEEQAAKLKAEKIRVALEKIKEAQVKKLVIRVHMSDDSSKTMMVDERQTVRQVLDNLMDKSHCGYSLDWSLVETISELQMERIFEDHENLVENLLNWTRDSQNKLIFMERIEKYALFKNPQNYLLGKKETAEMADRNKEVLLEECFCGSSVTVPEIEGVLWLKDDGKKSWKKRYFLLRASGIYYVPKGKAKVSRDLVCFLQLDHVNVYYGQDYRNKYKAPTDYCLVLKHPQIQKKSQYIKYLCCDDMRTLHQWVNGIRIAKYGKQLYSNYQEAVKRTESAYDWTSLSSSSIKSGSSSSSIPESQSNHSNQSDSGVSDTQPVGHIRSQSIVSSIFSEAWKRGTQLEESSKVTEKVNSLTQLKDTLVLHQVGSAVVQGQGGHTQATSAPELSHTLPGLLCFYPKIILRVLFLWSESLHKFTNENQMGVYSLLKYFFSGWRFSSVVLPPAAQVQGPKCHPRRPAQLSCAPLSQPRQGPVKVRAVLWNINLGDPITHASLLMLYSHVPFLKEHAIKHIGMPCTCTAGFLCMLGACLRRTQGVCALSLPCACMLSTLTVPHGLFPPQTPSASTHPRHDICSLWVQLGRKGEGATYPLARVRTGQGPTQMVPTWVNVCGSHMPRSGIISSKQESLPGFPAHVTMQSPPAVKAKPKWQPSAISAPSAIPAPSPDFPPPPPESSLVFAPPPPPPAPAPPPVPATASSTPDKGGSPGKKPSRMSSPGGKKPPPTPQRNSSIKSGSGTEQPEPKRPSVDSLVSRFAPPAEETPPPPTAPPKPGKLHLSGAGFPSVLQGAAPAKPPVLSGRGKDCMVEFPSPPSDSDFPPPPPETELPLPPIEIPPVFSGNTSPKVAVVNPQPQPWCKMSVKKAPPPTRPKRNDSTRLTQAELSEQPPMATVVPQVPTSPKSSLSVQPGFLADLNRTLQRKSITRHGSLSSSRTSRAEPTATMDDMALPPPPPELLSDQQKAGYGGSHISGYATLRRGPPPAPPKRDQNTKLSRDW
ncbi:Ras-associated and pleckstrin-like protein domains-containing protein 1 [Heterocephalus glaber]|uniref:Ras-associated and pleckstrin-like protein domains-containing protein 1 n=1 Tax=Heterocephalus glaber TaxID=10181 RepID=G5C9P4_HETGA|nr:Ras-associated and pleckstrin-like protein domains-containing protein 1 [Heterocephalus glaber]